MNEKTMRFGPTAGVVTVLVLALLLTWAVMAGPVAQSASAANVTCQMDANNWLGLVWSPVRLAGSGELNWASGRRTFSWGRGSDTHRITFYGLPNNNYYRLTVRLSNGQYSNIGATTAWWGGTLVLGVTSPR